MSKRHCQAGASGDVQERLESDMVKFRKESIGPERLWSRRLERRGPVDKPACGHGVCPVVVHKTKMHVVQVFGLL